MFGEKAPAHHPAAVSTAKFCIQEIEKSGGTKGRLGAGGWETAAAAEGLLSDLLSSPARHQGGHHHAAHADAVEGLVGLLPRRPGEELQ